MCKLYCCRLVEPAVNSRPEAELMKVHFRVGFWFLGIILRVLRLEVSVYNVYITNQFQTIFAWEVGAKSVIRGDCREENSLPLTPWRVCSTSLFGSGERGWGAPIRTRGQVLWFSRYRCTLWSELMCGCFNICQRYLVGLTEYTYKKENKMIKPNYIFKDQTWRMDEISETETADM
jgi:hypothetical protein